jgi:hypothetical protein
MKRIDQIVWWDSKSVLLFSMLAVLMVGQVAQVRADVVYTYVGPNFTLCDNLGTPCEVTNVSGTFSVTTALAANLNLAPITPNSFDFTNGLTSFTDTNSFIRTFSVSTDTSGFIVPFYSINLGQGPLPLTIATIAGPLAFNDFTEGYACVPSSCPDGGDVGIASADTQGTWTGGGTVTSAPEPPTAALLGAGIVGMGFLGWRSRRRNPRVAQRNSLAY